MKSREAVRALGALAHEYRLEVYRMLVREGPEGLPAGGVPASMAINPAKLKSDVDDGREVSAKPGSEQPASGQPGVNLVGEIDSILQKHVIANARLAHRSIHLRQPPGGLLQIVVDDRVYEHPNDIEDDDVRQILKQALKEWESR